MTTSSNRSTRSRCRPAWWQPSASPELHTQLAQTPGGAGAGQPRPPGAIPDGRSDWPRESPPNGGGPWPAPRGGRLAGRSHLRGGALRHRPFQVLQRPLRSHRGRRDAAPGGHVHRLGGPGGRVCLPLWRRGVPPAHAGLPAGRFHPRPASGSAEALAETGIPHAARPSAPSLVTFSGGVSCWAPGSPLSPLDVIDQADEALFVAKSPAATRCGAAPSLAAEIEATTVGG